MSDIFEEDKISKPKKKKKPDLSKSDTFGDNITSLSSDADVSDYLEDFLQHSKGAVFITGNDNINKTSSVKIKKIAKKTVKKRKNIKNKNGYYIMNGIVPHSSDEEEKKEKEEKTIFERLEREEEKERKEKIEKERIENERKEKEKIEKEEKERIEKEEKERKEREEKERKEKEEKERKEREEKERKEKEEKERKEKEEKERKEKEEKERKEKEERERKEREEKEKKEKEEKEKKEKEEKERIEKEEKEIEEKEKKMNEEKEEKEEMENENKKKKKIAKRIPKIQIKKEKSQIKMEDKKESDYSESSFKIFTQSNGEKSDNKKNNSESDYSYNYNCGKENSFETPAKNTLKKNNIISSDNKEKKEVTEEESEITEKMSEKYLLSINNSSEESEEESEEEIEREEIEKEDSGLEEEEESEEEKIEHKKKTKSIINNNRIKINLNEALNKYVKERNLKLIEKYSQFNNLIQRKLINEINNILKSLYIFLKIKNYKVNSIIKIESTYRGFILRQRFKLDYLTSKILNLREEYATKISSYYRMLLSRRQTKKLLRKTVDHYIIYSSLINNNQLYFKYKYQNGSDDNLYFEFCPMLKCFILFIDKREKMNKKILEGCFYNENYNALIDPLYEQNSKGENVINFPKIFQKEDLADEAKEIIISRYIKLHRPIKRRRERIEDYEERKRKMFEEEQHSSIRLSSSQTLKFRRIGDKVKKISRSKSFMKLKGFMKSILKPSKSYINLKCESKKKIHFGSAKIKRYHNLKK